MKHVGGLLIAMTMLVLSISSGHALAQPSSAPPFQSVMAINILLLPDATMVQHAQAVNARLRGIYPKGFSLDAAHYPHITRYQCFVPTADLERVYAAAGKVLARTDVTALKLKAFKSYYFPMESLGLSGIVVEPTPELVQLQRDQIAAVAPYTVKKAT